MAGVEDGLIHEKLTAMLATTLQVRESASSNSALQMFQCFDQTLVGVCKYEVEICCALFSLLLHEKRYFNYALCYTHWLPLEVRGMSSLGLRISTA